MDPKIKNFLEQVNRASDGRLAEDYPDPHAGFVFVGGPTPEYPGVVVIGRGEPDPGELGPLELTEAGESRGCCERYYGLGRSHLS